MKVYGTTLIAKDSWPTESRQPRVVVAASSKTAAARIFRMSLYAFNQYASQTGNEHEIAAAMSKPGTPFVQKCENGPDMRVYTEVIL